MKYFVWFLIAVLMVLHQDVWNWNDGRMVFGFMPVGLAYHVALSISASLVWLLAVMYAWPVDDADESMTR